jgi:hypothetical protein
MASLVRRVSTLTIIIALLSISSPSSAAPTSPGQTRAVQPAVRPIAFQGHRVEKADITLRSYPARDGSVEVEARGGDLQFRKSIRANGSYALTLQAPHDTIVIAVEEHTISITRDKKTVALSLGSATDEDFDKAQKMLADSRAARLMRAAAANVQDSGDDSPESASFILADAVVGMLTGDGAAPIRAARHLTRHVRANLRPAMLQVDCYTTWESRISAAYNDFAACIDDFAIWNPTRYLCATRWLLQAESYWFSFITCSGFSQF